MYLSTRMADTLIWLGRYQQRLETLGKESLIQFDAIIDRNPLAGQLLFQKLGIHLEYRCATDFLHQATFGSHPNSLFYLSSQARENAIVIRDLLSDSLFGSVNVVFHRLETQDANDSIDAYQLAHWLTEIEYFWGRLSTRLVKNRASQFILLGQSIELIDLKMRLHDEQDSLLDDAHHLNHQGQQLFDHWLGFHPLEQGNLHNNIQQLTHLSHTLFHHDA